MRDMEIDKDEKNGGDENNGGDEKNGGGEKNGGDEMMTQNGLRLYPVPAQASGEGLPYAPVDWPQPGDKWLWKVGKRIRPNGYFVDRYLYLPKRLQAQHKGRTFASKLSVEQYIRNNGADVDAFFSSFSWKIPSEDGPAIKAEHSGSDLQAGIKCCKAGNKSCSSIESDETSSGSILCDMCCSEPDFCRDCCCILCSKTTDSAYGGCDLIRCEAAIDVGVICGHIAHIECALRCYLAGNSGGSICLDAEYYCRRCDTRTDLLSHVNKLLQTCESIESRDDILNFLNLGACVLHDSQKPAAKQMLCRIKLLMGKIRSGTCLEDVWKVEDSSAANPGNLIDEANTASESSIDKKPYSAASPQKVSESFDPVIKSLNLNSEVDDILESLRVSQELEYNIARERLYKQKNYIQSLYQELGKERGELARHAAHNVDRDALSNLVVERIDQIKRELNKLKEMQEVTKGFGGTSKDILKVHFDMHSGRG